MNPDLDLTIERVIRAPREAVWRAWTDPARFARLSGRALDEGRIRDLEGYGFLARRPDQRLAVTREGFPVLDAVVADLAT